MSAVVLAASLAVMAWLLARHIREARVTLAARAAAGNMPVAATAAAAAARAGNAFLTGLEKVLRRFKVWTMRLDNLATAWIHRSQERSKKFSLSYHDWRMQKHGLPKISFESSFIHAIEEWFDGFSHRYTRRGVGSGRAALRDDLDAREKVLVAAILADPKDVVSYRELGLYYFEQGNLFDALSAFEAIRNIDPTNSEAAERVRHIREAMGMDPNAAMAGEGKK